MTRLSEIKLNLKRRLLRSVYNMNICILRGSRFVVDACFPVYPGLRLDYMHRLFEFGLYRLGC